MDVCTREALLQHRLRRSLVGRLRGEDNANDDVYHESLAYTEKSCWCLKTLSSINSKPYSMPYTPPTETRACEDRLRRLGQTAGLLEATWLLQQHGSKLWGMFWGSIFRASVMQLALNVVLYIEQLAQENKAGTPDHERFAPGSQTALLHSLALGLGFKPALAQLRCCRLQRDRLQYRHCGDLRLEHHELGRGLIEKHVWHQAWLAAVVGRLSPSNCILLVSHCCELLCPSALSNSSCLLTATAESSAALSGPASLPADSEVCVPMPQTLGRHRFMFADVES